MFYKSIRNSFFIKVRARPESLENQLIPLAEDTFEIQVKAPAEGGKANLAIVELLSRYLGCPKSSIRLIKGGTTRSKIFEVIS